MTLLERLGQPSIVVAPGVVNAWSGLLAERAGFEAVYLSGASVAYARLGRPDIGLVRLPELADVLLRPYASASPCRSSSTPTPALAMR